MIRFRMAKINVEQFAILVDKAPNESLSYTVNLGFKGASNAQRIACIFTATFLHNETIILKLVLNCEFDIHSDDWVTIFHENLLRVSKEDLSFFANQTVGTARGIMFCKTEGTDFSNFILPPIDLTKIIDQDLEIDFTNKQ